MSLVAYGSSGESDSDYEHNAEGSVKNGISGTGSPKSNRSTNNIADIECDSDGEEEPAKKKLKPTSGKSGLFSLLPAQKYAVTKEVNRALTPHTLTKKPAAPVSQKIKPSAPIKKTAPPISSAPIKLLPAIPDDERDEDNDAPGTSNFFSFGESNKKTAAPVSQKIKPSATIKMTAPPISSAPIKLLPAIPDDERDEGNDAPGTSNFFSFGESNKKPAAPVSQKIKPSATIKMTAPPISSVPIKLLPETPDDEREDYDAPGTSNLFSFGKSNKKPVAAPLPMALSAPLVHETKGSTVPEQPSTETPVAIGGMEGPPLSDIADAPLEFKPVAGPSYPARPSHSWGGGSSYSKQYNMAAAAAYDEDEQEETDEQEEGGSGDMELSMEGLLRLQGKKASQREKIEIIDIHQADQVKKGKLLKSLSEEQPTQMESHSKKKNKDRPSSQQKRKHQITQLAFKAKEQEIDLKNPWAQFKATKKAAPSRYGF